VGTAVSYAIAASDADADAYTITFNSGPAWLTFASPTQTNSSAVTAAQAGNYSVAM